MTAELKGRLAEIHKEIPAEARQVFIEHLTSTTSAEWLADVLTSEGYKVSASTIRTYRRASRKGVT